MIRKLGGYSFQEINASLEHLKRFTTWGPDLSYDFVTRPPYLYAMATGNAEPLRLMVRLMQKERLDPGILVHALQNHDELMFDLAHLRTHARKEFQLGDRTIRGKDLYQRMYNEAKQRLGESGLASMPEFSNLGFCGTLASYAAPGDSWDPMRRWIQVGEALARGQRFPLDESRRLRPRRHQSSRDCIRSRSTKGDCDLRQSAKSTA